MAATDATTPAGGAPQAAPPPVSAWKRLTRWRQTSTLEGRAAEAGVCALSGCVVWRERERE